MKVAPQSLNCMKEVQLNSLNLKCCNRCKRTQPLDVFRLSRRMADGRLNQCHSCELACSRARREADPEAKREMQRQWVAKNADRVREAGARYREKNREHATARIAAWHAANPERSKEITRRRNANRRATVSGQLRERISKSIHRCLRQSKNHAKVEELVGWSIAELRIHLERQFLRGMGWHNMGEWHIDHIVPISSFLISGPDDPEVRRAWALTNLRPLWATENIKKNARRLFLI